MRRRFRSKHRAYHEEGLARSRSRFGLLWVILAVVVLAMVIGYDRYGINQAQQRISQARAYERSGLYSEALREYKIALANKRLGRRPKAEVALAVGDLYYDHFENYDMAHSYFVQAKQNAPKLLDNPAAQERLKLAQQRSAGAGVRTEDGATTGTVMQRVQVMAPPQEDLRGPVVARYEGGEIRAGELLRLLKASPEYHDAALRDDPARLEQFLKRQLGRVLRYEAALKAGVQRDTDISARLYDYQRTLISERFAVQERQRAQAIPNQAVQQYYEQNKDRYVRPAAATIAMIKTNTQAEAEKALEQLRQGRTFAEVATSASIHQDSAGRGGLVGQITESSEEIAGVGKDPELVKALVAMNPNSVTGATPSNGAYFIFRVAFATPGHITTLEEARPQIEQVLRGQQVDASTTGLEKRLEEEYRPELAAEGLRRFWQFAVGDPTTGTLTTTTSLESATTATAATTTATNATTSTAGAS